MRSLRALLPVVVAFAALAPALVRADASTDEGCPHPLAKGPPSEARARRVYEQAVGLEQSLPKAAEELYQCAAELADKPAISLHLGLVAETAGDLPTARTALQHYLDLTAGAAPDAAEVRARINSLDRRIAETAPVASASAPPVASGAPATKADEAPPSGPPYAGYALIGGGVVLGVTSTILLVSAKSQSNRLQNAAPGTVRWDSAAGSGTLDRAKNYQTIGLLSAGVGAALAAIGVVLVVRGQPTTVHVETTPAGLTMGLTRAF